MSGYDLIKYTAFGYSFIIALLCFVLPDDLRNPKIFKKFMLASLVSVSIGIVLELTNVLDIEKGLSILLMSISTIYLVFYEVLRRLFRAWKGVDPCITSASSYIGGEPMGGFWTRYPRNRKIMWTDYLFSFAQALLPIATVVGLMIWIIEMNK